MDPSTEPASENFSNLARQPLQKLIGDFLNELQLSFEEKFPNLSNVRKVFKDATKTTDTFLKLADDIQSSLSPFEERINRILFSQRKVKSQQYDFMNDIKLFGDGIDFAVFHDENKSTKKTLIQYLHSMLLMCKLMTINPASAFEPTDEQMNMFKSFLTTTEEPHSTKVASSVRPKQHSNGRSKEGSNGDPLGGLSSLMDSVMSNPDIVSIAREITADIQTQNIDPMSMINGLMSGKPSSQLEGLISKIGSKIDQKISSGEIDKNTLEKQAQNILENVDLGETLKHIGGGALGKSKK